MDTNGNFHPVKVLTDPRGNPAEIDLGMVDVISAVWALHLPTQTCCQDLGGYLGASSRPSVRDQGKWYEGLASLEMSYQAAVHLLDRLGETEEFGPKVNHWANPGAWQMSAPVFYLPGGGFEVHPVVQMRMPIEQLPALADTIQKLAKEKP